MKPKLGISAAIMENPDIIILDEPINALDEQSVQMVKDLLINFKNEGKLILISSDRRMNYFGYPIIQ